jgi:hypothetical protein
MELKNQVIKSNPTGIVVKIFEELTTDSAHMRFIVAILAALIIIGICGNLINIAVFSRQSMRSTSTFRFLLYLSVCDLLVLLVCASDAYAQFQYRFEIRSLSELTCRIHTFLTYFLPQCSSNILTAVSIDRALVITNFNAQLFFRKIRTAARMMICSYKQNNFTRPLSVTSNIAGERRLANFDQGFGLRRVDLTVAVIILVIALFNLHYFILMTLNTIQDDTSYYLIAEFEEYKISSKNVCMPVSGSAYNTFLVYWWPTLDLIIFSLVPFLTMSVCSAVILFTIRKSTKKVFFIWKKKDGGVNMVHSNVYKERLRRNRQVLFMLVLTNLYFLLSSLPYLVLALMYKVERSNMPAMDSFVHTLLYSNNAVNFFFFGLSSEKYRVELVKIFLRKKKPNNTMSTSKHCL